MTQQIQPSSSGQVASGSAQSQPVNPQSSLPSRQQNSGLTTDQIVLAGIAGTAAFGFLGYGVYSLVKHPQYQQSSSAKKDAMMDSIIMDD